MTTHILLFLIGILGIALIACINVIWRLAEEVKYQTGRKEFWYEQAREFKALWLAALIAGDDDDGPDDGLGLNVPEEEDDKSDLPPLAMGMAVGKGVN